MRWCSNRPRQGRRNIRRGLEALERARRARACRARRLSPSCVRALLSAAPGRRLASAETVPGPTTDAFAPRARAWRRGRAQPLRARWRARVRLLAGDRRGRVAPGPDPHDPHHRLPVLPRAGLLHAGRYRRAGLPHEAGAIGVAICYDRHYPEYMRALALGGADLVVVPQAGALDEWPEGSTKARCASPRSRTATSWRSAIASARRDCLTFAGSRSCARLTAESSRVRRSSRMRLLVDVDLAEAAARTRDGSSCSIAGRSSTPSGPLRADGADDEHGGVRRLMAGRRCADAIVEWGCRDKDVVTRRHADEAREAGASGGDLPAGVPEGAHDIRMASDLNSSRRWGLFNFLQRMPRRFARCCRPRRCRSPASSAISRPRIEWWPMLPQGLDAEQQRPPALKAVMRSRVGDLIVVVNWKQGRAYYWSLMLKRSGSSVRAEV